jgi:hypothetical protein
MDVAKNNYQELRGLLGEGGLFPPLKVVTVAEYPHRKTDCREVTCIAFNGNAETYLRNSFANALKESRSQRGFIDLKMGDDLGKNQVGIIPVDRDDLLQNFIDEVRQDLQSETNFQGSPVQKNGVKYKIARYLLGEGSEEVYFFKKFTKSQQLDRRGLTVLLTQGVFNEVQGVPFLLDDSVEFFYFRAHYYVLNPRTFETISGYSGSIRESAIEGLDKICAALPIDDELDFREKVTSYHAMQRKMALIHEHFDAGAHTLEYCEERAVEFGLDLPTAEKDDGSRMFSLKGNASARWHLLSVLDDSLYIGPNSNQKIRSLRSQRI